MLSDIHIGILFKCHILRVIFLIKELVSRLVWMCTLMAFHQMRNHLTILAPAVTFWKTFRERFFCLCVSLFTVSDSLMQNKNYGNVHNYTLIRLPFRVSLMQSELVKAGQHGDRPFIYWFSGHTFALGQCTGNAEDAVAIYRERILFGE
jgi:hypothetical protein